MKSWDDQHKPAPLFIAPLQQMGQHFQAPSIANAPAHGVGLPFPSVYCVLTKGVVGALISVSPLVAAEAHRVIPQNQACH